MWNNFAEIIFQIKKVIQALRTPGKTELNYRLRTGNLKAYILNHA